MKPIPIVLAKWRSLKHFVDLRLFQFSCFWHCKVGCRADGFGFPLRWAWHNAWRFQFDQDVRTTYAQILVAFWGCFVGICHTLDQNCLALSSRPSGFQVDSIDVFVAIHLEFLQLSFFIMDSCCWISMGFENLSIYWYRRNIDYSFL